MQQQQERMRGPMTEERLVRAVEVLAGIVKEHGPAYGPLYEAVEQELNEFRRLHQTVSGAAERTSGVEANRAA